VTSDGVAGDTETALIMRLMEPHVDPSDVLLVPCLVGISGALLQEGVADLPINMLLLEDVLIYEVNQNDRWGGERVVGGVLPRICIGDGVCVTVYV
jgi:hypothetical protein